MYRFDLLVHYESLDAFFQFSDIPVVLQSDFFKNTTTLRQLKDENR